MNVDILVTVLNVNICTLNMCSSEMFELPVIFLALVFYVEDTFYHHREIKVRVCDCVAVFCLN